MQRIITGIVLVISLLAGCGQMGPLYLPTPATAKHTSATHLDNMIKSA